jgi:hypothetical protein
MRAIKYRHILKPSVDYLANCGVYWLTTKNMADFLGVPLSRVQQLVYTDRIPLPMKFEFSGAVRWNIFELLDWVEAGCPRRTEWIEMRGSSGWYPLWRWR